MDDRRAIPVRVLTGALILALAVVVASTVLGLLYARMRAAVLENARHAFVQAARSPGSSPGPCSCSSAT